MVIVLDTGSAKKLDYRLDSARWSESPVDLPVSDCPILVLKMCATKLRFYGGAEGLRMLVSEISCKLLFILFIHSVILKAEIKSL